MSNTTLLPCPFCGDDETQIEASKKKSHRAFCPSCLISTRWLASEEIAIENWNSRVVNVAEQIELTTEAAAAVNKATERIYALEKDIETLTDWKASAMWLLERWGKVVDKVQVEAHANNLGMSIAEIVLNRLEAYDALMGGINKAAPFIEASMRPKKSQEPQTPKP